VSGGSGYFDGSGDYLNTTSGTSLGSGNWTVECWVYFVTAPAADGGHILCSYDYYTSGFNGNAVFRCGTSYLYRSFNGQTQQGEISGSFTWKTNTWYHVAWSRVSNVITCYQNGVSIGSTTDSTTLADFANGAVMGVLRANGSLSEYQNYYIGGLKVTPATALYTGTFTPPTSPFTISSGTSLLLTNTNAGILDNAMMNDLETVGNAQISTSVKKYGTGSIYLDGSGDYLLLPNTPLLDQIGDYTYECWYYRAGSGAGGLDILCLKNVTNMLYIYVDQSSQKFGVNQHNVGGFLLGTTVTVVNTWYHVAMCRSGSTVRLFVNGVQEASGTYSTNVSGTATTTIGGFTSSGYSMNGYLDDLRVTKAARYTTNFTPPTSQVQDQ
jgi:hypothetical protein